jgi:hypothetical protein
MPVRTKHTIFRAALHRVGYSEASQDSALWRALEANYDEIVRAAFEDGGGVFPFGKKHLTLTSRSDGNFGFEDSFVFPMSVIHVTQVYLAGVSCTDLKEPWDIDGESNAVLVNAAEREVKIDGVVEGQEYTWSAAFTLVIQRRLEAVVKDVLEETQEAQAKEQDADFLMMKAGVKGSKNRSANRLFKKGRGRLLTARRTRSSRGRG